MQNTQPLVITGGSKLGIDILKAQNPQYADKINEMARTVEGRIQLVAMILDNLKGRIQSVTDIQWSVIGLSAPGWILLCIGGIDKPCPTVAREFIVEMFRSYSELMPDVAKQLLDEITAVVRGSARQRSEADGDK